MKLICLSLMALLLAGCFASEAPSPPDISFTADNERNTVLVLRVQAGVMWETLDVLGCNKPPGEVVAGQEMSCTDGETIKIIDRQTNTLLFQAMI